MDASNEPPIFDIDSHSQSLVNGSDINHLQYNEIWFDKLSSEDLKGKEFKTVEESDAFYYAYAKAMGFDVRSDYKRFSVCTKDKVTSCRLLCSAQGKRKRRVHEWQKKARGDIDEAIEQDVQETCLVHTKKTKTIQAKDTAINAINNMADDKSCVIKKEKNSQLELKEPVQTMQRRGPGRPRGAKNKPKKGTTDA
ncbi:hypothetical protein M0R45_015271 [Rubus argutus]|uniref:FAR1 domain-containing protein n=1 Tax=Rubus argutus TaxID=59490 RepID=A0AAW1XQ53_RUBAR